MQPWRRLCVLVLLAAFGIAAGAAPGSGRARPAAAIVFEHAGASLTALAPVYAMHRPFGLGIFPGLPYSVEISKEAPAHGLEAILHLPLEAVNPADSRAPGEVRVGMSDAEIRRVVLDDLFTVPGVIGVSNHAGSRATADPRVMRDVLGVVRDQGLWFEENRVTPRSVVPRVAHALGVRLLVITEYLDADPAPAAIAARVRALIQRARASGMAVAAAHIGTGSPEVVRGLLPAFDRAGVTLVPPSDFLR